VRVGGEGETGVEIFTGTRCATRNRFFITRGYPAYPFTQFLLFYFGGLFWTLAGNVQNLVGPKFGGGSSAPPHLNSTPFEKILNPGLENDDYGKKLKIGKRNL